MDRAGRAVTGQVGLVAAAREVDWAVPVGQQLSDAADARTRILIDGFVHEAGPPPSRFS